jgi:hypothetical protein
VFEEPMLDFELDDEDIMEGAGTRGEALKHVFKKLFDKKKRVAVEFECGECCKKVVNGAKVFAVKNLLFLLPAKGECLFLKVISCGKIVDKQILSFIIIPFDRVCAIEFGTVQVDP